MDFILSAIIQGLAFTGLGLGIYLSLRVFNIPDITTDGSYTLGGAVCAVTIMSGFPLVFSLTAALLAGALAGMCTGLIFTRLKVNPLLAGILVMTALYSVNLIFMGRSNIPLNNSDNSLSLSDTLPLSKQFIYYFLLAIVLIFILNRFLKTDFGIALRATGNSESMALSLGVNSSRMKVIGLAIANSLTALSGALITCYQGFADINMGIGIVITGIASLMIGETLLGALVRQRILYHLAAIIAGTVLFRLAIAGALSAGLDPNYLRLATAAIVLVIVALGMKRKPYTA